MREAKRNRLQAKGWRVGSTQEFLGLPDNDMAYVELKLRLATSLRALRRRREFTQAELGKLLKSSESRVTKMEAGDRSVSLDLLIRSLLALGTTSLELSRIIATRRPAPAA